MKNHLSCALVAVIFLFWALAPNIKGAGNTLLFLAFILSAAFWREMKNPQLRHWALLLALPFLFTLCQKLFFFPDLKPNVFDAPSRFLLAGACIFAFYKTNAEKLSRALSGGVIVGAIGLGLWAYVSTHFESFFWIDGKRAWNGFSNPIPFGLLATIFAMMAISLPQTLFAKIPQNAFWALKICACLAGLYAAFASLSRVALFVLPFLVFILILQNIQKSKKLVVKILAVSAILIVGVLTIENPYQDRVLFTIKEVQRFEHNPHSSMGLRFLMWKEAFKIISENPIKGVGKFGYSSEVRQRLKDQRIEKDNPLQKLPPPHPHSDLLNFGVEFGLPGFALALLFYFAPLVFFLKRLKSKNLVIQSAATNGAMVVAAFALAGTLDTYFWITNQTAFYGLCVSLFVGMILQVEKNSALTKENRKT